MTVQGGTAAPGTGRIRGLAKALTAACVGLGGGVIATYTTAVVDRVTKPGKPVANFAVAADGLTVTCQNHATADSGWWDFGDGSPLEPFAPDQPATHTYKKAGDYTVKLTVRNFLNEEADRSVPVDLSASAPQTLPPSVTKLTAEPINPSAVAPAAFRIRGEVANAEKVIWDLGDGKLDVTTDSGPFERLVVFDKPGTHGIQVIGSSGKQAVKQAAAVTVAAPAAGALAVVLQVTDIGTRGMTEDYSEYVKVPLPKAAETKFEATVPVRKGMAADEARVGAMTNPTVKNVLAAVSPDKRSVKVTGDWAMTGEALTKAANNGLGVMIPIKVVAEKSVAFQKPPTEMAVPMTGQGGQAAAVLALPPMPPGVANVKRRVKLEIRQASADGRTQVLATVTDPQFPWTAALPTGGTATAQMVGGQLRVVVTTGTSVAALPAATPFVAPAPVPPATPAVAPHLPLRPYTTPSPVQQFGRPQGVRQ